MAKRKARSGSFFRDVADDIAESARYFGWISGTGTACGGLAGYLTGGVATMAVGAVLGAIAGAFVWWVLTDHHIL